MYIHFTEESGRTPAGPYESIEFVHTFDGDTIADLIAWPTPREEGGRVWADEYASDDVVAIRPHA